MSMFCKSFVKLTCGYVSVTYHRRHSLTTTLICWLWNGMIWYGVPCSLNNSKENSQFFSFWFSYTYVWKKINKIKSLNLKSIWKKINNFKLNNNMPKEWLQQVQYLIDDVWSLRKCLLEILKIQIMAGIH